MHLNSATSIRVPTKGGSPSAEGEGNPPLMANRNRDNNSSNNNNNNTSRRLSRNWSLGSFDLLDNPNNDNYFLRSISNGSLDVAARLFSSFREIPKSSSSTASARNSLGIQAGVGSGGGGGLGGASMANYDFGNLMGNNGLGIGMRANMEGSGRTNAVGLNLDSLYESELRAGRDAGVLGQGNRSVALAMKSSEAASALRRIEMEESLLHQPYQNMEERHQRMKAILQLQQQQHQMLKDESHKIMLTSSRYTPLQTHSPQPQQLQLPQNLLMQEQQWYQNQGSRQSSSPPRRKPSRERETRLTDYSTEELFQEMSRRRGETSSVPNASDDGMIGEMGRGERIDSVHYMPSTIEQQNEGYDRNTINAVLREDRIRRLNHLPERVAESSPRISGGNRVLELRDSSAMVPTTKTFSKLVDEATNSSVVSSSTHVIGINDVVNDDNNEVPRRKRRRESNTSFDTLLSVFGDELAELDREESGRSNPKENAKVATSLPGSVGTITVEEFMAGTSGDEASDEYESSRRKKSSSISNISPIYDAQLFSANLPPRKSSRINEDSPSAASVDAMTIETIVRERALHQMRMDMREHLARTAELGAGSSSIPSSLSSSSSARAYLAELQGLLLPPPPLSHSTMAMHYAQLPNRPPVQRVHPTTAKAPPPTPPPPPPQDRIDPKAALQKFLDMYGEKAENSRTNLLNAISETEKSLVTIHDWDRSRGLRKCHSRTVVKTRRSRAKVKAFLLGVDPPKELVKKPKRNKKETG